MLDKGRGSKHFPPLPAPCLLLLLPACTQPSALQAAMAPMNCDRRVPRLSTAAVVTEPGYRHFLLMGFPEPVSGHRGKQNADLDKHWTGSCRACVHDAAGINPLKLAAKEMLLLGKPWRGVPPVAYLAEVVCKVVQDPPVKYTSQGPQEEFYQGGYTVSSQRAKQNTGKGSHSQANLRSFLPQSPGLPAGVASAAKYHNTERQSMPLSLQNG